MTHDEALEALELAAVEPGGLDRLMAGDTAVAAAVAAHVAGCPACAAQLDRLSAQVPLLRDVIRTTPPPDLRERTLEFVRARGVAREVATSPAPPPAPSPPRHDRPVMPWVAALAAVLVVSVVAGTVWLGGRLDDQLAARDAQIAQLSAVTGATLSVTSEPDVRRVALAADDGAAMAGTLLFSPGTSELVVVARGLPAAPAGREYRCWILRDGRREVVGKMFFGGDLAYWVGDVAAVRGLTGDATFGVSLVDVGASALDAEPVITGDL